ncbi:sulfotransferase family 2 domain-containing protein [Altererythrobacter sp. ZODW24]|uniref:sulfotransferase family 2 domain-containing protein n=1 Tax=Altererythrobacter sp. ZODW24 TaxID=2185142 RepID=UPI000DF7B05A|nr:sulfotransferase family 2 domain-containing protein [Altererythrobacter sp. ZODW24]
MIVSDDRNFIYARIPKTASTSVSAALEPYRRKADAALVGRIGRRLLPKSAHPALVNFRAHSHWGLQAAREVMGEEFFSRATKFTVARHPFAWITSLYNHVLRMENDADFKRVFAPVFEQSQSLNTFIGSLESRPIPPQSALLVDYDGNMLADHVARVELLEDEIRPIFAACGIEAAIPALNRGTYSAAEGLSAHSMTLIKSIYAVDFEMFGYDNQGPDGPVTLSSTLAKPLGRHLRSMGALDFSPWEPMASLQVAAD